MQAAQLPDQQEPAERPGPYRDAQILPLVRPPHSSQGNALDARVAVDGTYQAEAAQGEAPRAAAQGDSAVGRPRRNAVEPGRAGRRSSRPRRSRSRDELEEQVDVRGADAGRARRGAARHRRRDAGRSDARRAQAPARRGSASRKKRGAPASRRRSRSARRGAAPARPRRQLPDPGLGRAAPGPVAGPQPGHPGDRRRRRLLLPRRRLPRVLGLRLQQARQWLL